MFIKTVLRAGMVVLLLILELRRKKQVDFCESEASLYSEFQ